MNKYPGITAACQLIALDNGGINRLRAMGDQNVDLERWIEDKAQFTFDIMAMEAWLVSLSDEQLDAVCCGGEGEPEQVAALALGPPGANDFLNCYFEDVC